MYELFSGIFRVLVECDDDELDPNQRTSSEHQPCEPRVLALAIGAGDACLPNHSTTEHDRRTDDHVATHHRANHVASHDHTAPSPGDHHDRNPDAVTATGLRPELLGCLRPNRVRRRLCR